MAVPRRPSTHVDDPKLVGQRLRQSREQAGFSQAKLSFDGCTTAYISRIEAGTRIPSLQILTELAKRLDVPVDYLANGREVGGLAGDPLTEAEMALRLDDPLTARKLFKEILRAASDDLTRARATAGLGHVAFEAGDHDGAVELFSRAIELAPQLEDDATIADNLGRAYAFTSRYEEALAVFEPRLRAAEERKDFIETIRFSVLLANTLADRGRYGHAEEILGHALALGRESHDPLVRARLWWTQARLHALQNDPTLAERYARLALAETQLTEHARYSAAAFQTLALLKNDQGESEQALDLVQEGFALVLEGGNAFQQGLFRTEEARALARTGRLDEAQEAAERARVLLDGASPGDSARALGVLADVREAQGDVDGAIDLYRQVIDDLPPAGRFTVEAYARLGELLRRAGRTEEALDVLSAAVSLHEAGVGAE
jgi:tetratricopeptide (TPR) repeat protein